MLITYSHESMDGKQSPAKIYLLKDNQTYKKNKNMDKRRRILWMNLIENATSGKNNLIENATSPFMSLTGVFC